MKAMASDVEKRYLSAEAMLEDLEEFRKNPNISFDYTDSDLLAGEGDEPTRPIRANTPQVAVAHTGMGKQEEKKQMRQHPRREELEDDEEYEGGGFVRGLIIISSVIACLAGVVYFLWIIVFSSMFKDGETYEVPRITGYTYEEAVQLVEGTGFTLKDRKSVV